MKHIKLASAIAFVLGVAAVGTASASTGGTITLTGSVSDATCTVSGGTGTDGGTGNFNVALDQASLADVATAGTVSHNKPFQVMIGGPGQSSCAAGTVATMGFLPSSTQIDAATGALQNALASGAKNVEIQLADSVGTAIDLTTGATQMVTVATGATQATLDYSAQYLPTAVGTSGLISTSVVYNVDYN